MLRVIPEDKLESMEDESVRVDPLAQRIKVKNKDRGVD
jgi:hypothetical protein